MKTNKVTYEFAGQPGAFRVVWERMTNGDWLVTLYPAFSEKSECWNTQRSPTAKYSRYLVNLYLGNGP